MSENHLLWCPGGEHANTLVLELLGNLFRHAGIWRAVTEDLNTRKIRAGQDRGQGMRETQRTNGIFISLNVSSTIQILLASLGQKRDPNDI